ncbi:ribosomal subunit interface protein [Aequorivita sublithincola DSM 14238]|uniref:Ribosomal subunit interface protein n=1 Tax=Aequorivita sublithincola (strain DSM 14238 / LMG 21431 / ACAM 643 / 9-3) TaxID=746697 RepID=I3YRR8_AEQSU|nr:ribosome-associated translation inhibitor RaiA [Aequorivita sublithincola]AFL79686.1 ribosomal subunit interface protein [Aequorivita sublithincola DSM 14238]
MTINIQYVKMPTSEAMNKYVEKRLNKIAEKYEWLIRADVSFKLENNVYGKGNICEMELSLPGPKIFATSTEATFEAAAKETISDIEKQLKKRKAKFTIH